MRFATCPTMAKISGFIFMCNTTNINPLILAMVGHVANRISQSTFDVAICNQFVWFETIVKLYEVSKAHINVQHLKNLNIVDDGSHLKYANFLLRNLDIEERLELQFE